MISKAKNDNPGHSNSGLDSGKFGSKPNKEETENQSQNDFNDSNQLQSNAVHAEPMAFPMIPLPTQDFRL